MPLADHVVERLERQIRIDGAGAVADQQREVMHFARVAAFDDQRRAVARAFAHQVMVHAGGRQQARNRRQLADSRRGPTGSGSCSPRRPPRSRAPAGPPARGARPLPPDCGLEQHRHRDRPEAALVDVAQPRQLVVVDDGRLDLDLPARLRARASAGCASGPIVEPIDVTSSSRIASSGGLVTCANSCLK